MKNIKANDSGLTLIELMVVIFIITILLSVALPRLDVFSSNNVRIFARKFSGEIKQYFTKAVLYKTAYKIKIDFANKNSYSVYVYSDGDWKDVKTNVMLPENVFFEDLTFNSDKSVISTESGEIKFSSLGYMDNVTIHISDGKNKVFTLITNSLSGKVFVFDGNN